MESRIMGYREYSGEWIEDNSGTDGFGSSDMSYALLSFQTNIADGMSIPEAAFDVCRFLSCDAYGGSPIHPSSLFQRALSERCPIEIDRDKLHRSQYVGSTGPKETRTNWYAVVPATTPKEEWREAWTFLGGRNEAEARRNKLNGWSESWWFGRLGTSTDIDTTGLPAPRMATQPIRDDARKKD
jgi:hypothetical protein